jgi:hypothetical protein
MPRENGEPFEAMTARIARREVAEVSYREHPTLEMLLGLLDGNASAEPRDTCAAHLALCPACRSKLENVQGSLSTEMRRLKDSPALGTLPAFLVERHGVRRANALGEVLGQAAVRLRRLLQPLPAAVLATSVALIAAICVLGPPAYREWKAGARLPVRSAGESGVQVKEFVLVGVMPQDLSAARPESLVQAIDAVAGSDDVRAAATFGRAAATILGLLRSAGAPLEHPSVTFKGIRSYTVQPGDTWESIAQQELEDAALWSLVLLLNRAATDKTGEPPVPGMMIALPRRSDGV